MQKKENEMLPWLVSLPGIWIRELPEEDELILDHHGDQAGGALTVTIGTGGHSKGSGN